MVLRKIMVIYFRVHLQVKNESFETQIWYIGVPFVIENICCFWVLGWNMYNKYIKQQSLL